MRWIGLSHLIALPRVEITFDTMSGSPGKSKRLEKPDSVESVSCDEGVAQQVPAPTGETWDTGDTNT